MPCDSSLFNVTSEVREQVLQIKKTYQSKACSNKTPKEKITLKQ